ncbi:33463896-a377-439a-a860-07435853af59 [Thermothielavioides terrestris]
MSML